MQVKFGVASRGDILGRVFKRIEGQDQVAANFSCLARDQQIFEALAQGRDRATAELKLI